MKSFLTILTFLICYQGFSQQPVFVATQNVYSLNLNNCTSRLVGVTKQPFLDIAFTPDGKLWGIAGGVNSGLYLIDTTNASTTFIGSPKKSGVSLVALNDSILLSEYYDTLWGINVRNVQSYYIGVIGYSACGDLSWYNGDLYMTAYNQLIKIVLNSTNTAVISSTPVNDTSKPLPCLLGLITASFNGVDSLIGINNIAYRISPIDRTYQPICLSLNDSFGIYGAASLPLGVYPIQLLNFSYTTLLNKTVNLQWQTTTETNSNYFLIQRSADGTNFSTIGKQAAANNSSTLKQYYFADNDPLSINYYRLKEVDLNGNSTYSNTLLVKLPQQTALQILQNPVQNSLQVQVNSGAPTTSSLSIFDFSGRKLKTLTVTNGVQTIDVSALPAGVYILQLITNNGDLYNERFVKGN